MSLASTLFYHKIWRVWPWQEKQEKKLGGYRVGMFQKLTLYLQCPWIESDWGPLSLLSPRQWRKKISKMVKTSTTTTKSSTCTSSLWVYCFRYQWDGTQSRKSSSAVNPWVWTHITHQKVTHWFIILLWHCGWPLGQFGTKASWPLLICLRNLAKKIKCWKLERRQSVTISSLKCIIRVSETWVF